MDLNAADFAIGTLVPRSAHAPASAEAVRDAVRECGAAGERFAPWGGGVSLPHAAPPARCERAIVLRALDRVTRWEPDDFTLTAECGVTIAALRERLAERGQELPLECADEARATLGGVLAANASGARRGRFGAPRDRILGARFVTGDGVLARTGGGVVKNVAGHAVHRLMVGAEGALGVFVEASLKLLPLPPARLALAHGADAALLQDAGRWRGFARREPAALSVLGAAAARAALGADAADAPFTVVTGFEDHAARVAECAALTRDALGAGAATREDREVPPLWRALADLEERPGERLTCVSAHRSPVAVAPLAALACADSLVFHAGHGRLYLWPRADEREAALAAAVAAGFTPVAARGFALPPRALAGAARALRERLSAALDPGGACALGEAWRTR